MSTSANYPTNPTVRMGDLGTRPGAPPLEPGPRTTPNDQSRPQPIHNLVNQYDREGAPSPEPRPRTPPDDR
jgi:hypothetical protein